MSIAVVIHGRRDARALAELIQDTLHDEPILDHEPQVAHLSELVSQEEREVARRRAAWHWLNSISNGLVDKDNDWSDV